MQIPTQITFRHMRASPSLEAKIRTRVDHLGRFHPRIIGCRVVVDQVSRHHAQGNQFHVQIRLTLPNHELVAGNEPPAHQANQDPWVALRDAFDSLRRQLEDLARRDRGEVKRHEPPLRGRVTLLNPSAHCGTITTEGDLHPVYFHAHSLVGFDFDKLLLGMEVRFSEEEGDHGPQASTVHVPRTERPSLAP